MTIQSERRLITSGQIQMGLFFAALIAVLMAPGFTPDAKAIPITFSYEGIVTGGLSGDDPGDPFNNELMTVSFTFEDSTPGGIPGSGNAVTYTGAITAITVSLAGATWTGSSGDILIADGAGLDRFQVNNAILTLSSGVDPANIGRFGLSFTDNTTNAFNSTALAGLTQPDAADFLPALTFMFLAPAGPSFEEALVLGPNITISANAVPGPAGLPLLGAGLLAVGLMRKRVKRRIAC